VSSGDLTVDSVPVTVTRHPGVDVVAVAGDLDALLQSTMRRVVADATCVAQTEVVLDLSATTPAEPDPVPTLIALRRVLANRAANLSLVCREDHLTTRLSQGAPVTVPVYADLDDAVRSLSAGR
jgi:hypothetical protein